MNNQKSEKTTIKLNNNFEIDLTTLIDTRLLVQANSGGGKSWCIRRILEQSHGKVQQIIIDLEGEFSTLREKYDYILAGKDGDTPAEPRSAALLARRLLELNVSAVIDLYELDHLDRKRFVKLFLDSMVNAPKKFWHPCIVIIDEAHVFCPEKGQAESAGSVIDLMTRGRKRGYCGVLATQRLSKLHKDAAAECNNKLIGRTGLDVDMKRAGEELGFTTSDQRLSLRSLGAGEFFVFGPAISNEVIKVKIGQVETTHPKAGSRILNSTPIPPTAKIRAVLGRLADLPQEAEKEARDINVLTNKVHELEKQLRQAMNNEAKIDEKTLDEIRQVHNQELKSKDDLIKALQKKLENIKDGLLEMSDSITIVELAAQGIIEAEYKGIPIIKEEDNSNGTFHLNETNEEPLPLAARKIYTFLYNNQSRTFTKVQVGFVTGYSPNSGGFNNALSYLNSRGLITRKNSSITIRFKDFSLINQGAQEEWSPETWVKKLPLAPRKIFEYLWNNPNAEVNKEHLGEITGYSANSGGFNNALSKLNSLGLIVRQQGFIKLNQELREI